MIKAVFFDRDGTLTYGNKAIHDGMYSYIIEKTNNATFGRFENYMHFHERTEREYQEILCCNTKEKADVFWQKLYEFVFEEYGTGLDCEKEAREFLIKYPQHRLKSIFPEVVEVLEYCQKKNLYLGIISDCDPYLEDSITPLGIGKYFSRYIAAAEVGVMKPDPKIFMAAIKGLNLKPSECLFIDDTKDEVDGAREFGFRSLHINRRNRANEKQEWEIEDLKQIYKYLY